VLTLFFLVARLGPRILVDVLADGTAYRANAAAAAQAAATTGAGSAATGPDDGSDPK
jgi:hypothetical protein